MNPTAYQVTAFFAPLSPKFHFEPDAFEVLSQGGEVCLACAFTTAHFPFLRQTRASPCLPCNTASPAPKDSQALAQDRPRSWGGLRLPGRKEACLQSGSRPREESQCGSRARGSHLREDVVTKQSGNTQACEFRNATSVRQGREQPGAVLNVVDSQSIFKHGKF